MPIPIPWQYDTKNARHIYIHVDLAALPNEDIEVMRALHSEGNPGSLLSFRPNLAETEAVIKIAFKDRPRANQYIASIQQKAWFFSFWPNPIPMQAMTQMNGWRGI